MTFDEVSDNLLFPLDDKEVGNKDQHSSTKGGSFQESIQTGMELKLEDVNPENENYGAATESIVREEWMTRSHVRNKLAVSNSLESQLALSYFNL